MLWRFFFRFTFVYILIDGFFVNFFYMNPYVQLIKDFMIFWIYFFYLNRENITIQGQQLFAEIGTIPTLFIFALLGLGILQIFNPTSPGLLRGMLGLKVMFLPWLLVLPAYTYINSTDDVRNFIKMIALASIPINLFGLLQFQLGPAFIMGFGPGFYRAISVANIYGVAAQESFVRVISTFASSGQYTHFLIVNTMLCLGLYYSSENRRHRYFWLLTLTINLMALLATGTRSAIATTALATFLFAFLYRKGRTTFMMIFIASFLFYFGGKILGKNISKRVSTLTETGMVKERTIETTPKMFLKFLERDPMGRGIGAGSTATRYLGETEGKWALVENFLSKLQYELGIVGVLLFYLFVAALLLQWHQTWLRVPFDPKTFVIFLSLTSYEFAQFGITSLFGSIDSPPACFFIWTFVGMCAKLVFINRSSYSEYFDPAPNDLNHT